MQKLKQLYQNEKDPREIVAQLNSLSDLQTLSGVIVDDSIEKMEDIWTLKLTFKNQRDRSSELETSISLAFICRGSWKQASLTALVSGRAALPALTLSLTKPDTDPMPTLGQLPSLKLLRLFSKSFMGDNMRSLQDSFRQLRVLKRWKPEELRQWTVYDSTIRNLEELQIRSCKNLEMLPDVPKTLLPQSMLTAMLKKFTSIVVSEDCERNLPLNRLS
ncbi:hypothetical protein NE237_009451 [Protea cynaroides]|uniref:Uncharacterized protein n=1 Tax=Protea cynaroides TaxID=273540 RepID=A0A9Q0KXV6_9MAGN|nr:hypothetical protein NE237_009451 [Protea cynaroides]